MKSETGDDDYECVGVGLYIDQLIADRDSV